LYVASFMFVANVALGDATKLGWSGSGGSVPR